METKPGHIRLKGLWEGWSMLRLKLGSLFVRHEFASVDISRSRNNALVHLMACVPLMAEEGHCWCVPWT